jgi:hypothetical protein
VRLQQGGFGLRGGSTAAGVIGVFEGLHKVSVKRALA